MKKLALIMIFAIITFSVTAQEMFHLRLNDYQYVENKDGGLNSQLKLPNNNATIIIGGLNDLDGLNNYINLFGSKLIVDSLNMGSDGIQNIILRREDGRDFFDLFPTVSGKLIPVIHPQNENKDNPSIDSQNTRIPVE